MHIELFSRVENIPIDKEKWNNLVCGNVTNTVFQTYEWFMCWWNNFGHSYRLIFLTASDKSGLIGFAPLMIGPSQYSQKTLRFVGDNNADYCDFVICGNRLKTIDGFVSFLYSKEIDWSCMTLLNIPDYSTTKACLETICYKNRYNIQIKSPVPAPALIIKDNLDNALAIINKYSINRHIRKLNKLGKLDFYSLKHKELILNHIEHFFEQHISRYKLKGLTSQFLDVNNRQFYIDLINQFEDSQWLLFSILELNGSPIAYHLGFDYNNKLIWYKPTFDIKFSSFSPGTIMLKELIDYSIKTSHTELDFTIGDEEFKNRFCNRIRYNQNIAIYRSRLIYYIYIFRQRVSYIIQSIKKFFTNLR